MLGGSGIKPIHCCKHKCSPIRLQNKRLLLHRFCVYKIMYKYVYERWVNSYSVSASPKRARSGFARQVRGNCTWLSIPLPYRLIGNSKCARAVFTAWEVLDGLKRNTKQSNACKWEIFDNVDLYLIMFKVPRCLIHIAMVLTTGVRSCGSAETSVPKIMH